jgi:hypothetical protein
MCDRYVAFFVRGDFRCSLGVLFLIATVPFEQLVRSCETLTLDQFALSIPLIDSSICPFGPQATFLPAADMPYLTEGDLHNILPRATNGRLTNQPN